jgi:transcriptional regulator with XRE-family HTH domain
MGVKVTLKALRANSNLTQKAAAERVGVSEDTWANWEKYKSFPDVRDIEKIREAFGVNYEDLIFLPQGSV